MYEYNDGYVEIPEMPGPGIAVDEEKVREAAKKGHNWRNPVWRNGDGTIAEW